MADYYYDDYNTDSENQMDGYDYMAEDYDDYDNRSLADAINMCVVPTLLQTANFASMLFGWSLLCRALWNFQHYSLPKGTIWMHHITSICCGCAALYFLIGYEFLLVLFFSLIAYAIMLTIGLYKIKGMGIIITIVLLTSHFISELILDRPEALSMIRGIQMLATMKIISFAFDAEPAVTKEKPSTLPALMPYLGYIFCPTSCVLGPWVPYISYLNIVHVTSFDFRGFLRSIFNFIAASIFVCLSNCIIPLLCSNGSWQWLRIYRDALSVRFSHYFICFLSQMTLAAAESNKYSLFGDLTTKPWSIEFPRSLTTVVRYWNIPMHYWLKNYVFREVHNTFGNYLIAILCTYVISSLLHGLHLQIYLVLLSIGYFAYVENVLRTKLAHIFDACITANSCCRTPCKFKYCTTKGWNVSSAHLVRLVNFLFSLLCIFHLAYLGIMMSDHDNISISIQKWSKLSYLNHWIATALYLFYKII